MRDQWTGCYDIGWGKNLVPEAFSHPAKVSFSLAGKIYDHCINLKWIKKGDLVLDPFGGICGFGFHALCYGLNFIAIELEEKFVKLGEQNIELWNRKMKGWPNLGTARIIQGDSRKLKDVVSEASLIISSPPYAEGGIGHHGIEVTEIDKKKGLIMFATGSYGNNPANLKNLPEGNFQDAIEKADLVVSSPPFLEVTSDHPSKSIINSGLKMGKSSMGNGYGHTFGNLANLKEEDFDLICSSPPYVDSVNSGRDGIDWNKAGRPDRMQPSKKAHYPQGVHGDFKYGEQEGQLGAMKEGSIDAVISSPPYEDPSHGRVDKKDYFDKIGGIRKHCRAKGDFEENNLYYQKGDTFWSASREIVQQCYDLLKDGGHAIWVTKDYVKKGQRVPFTDRWLTLCESVGFKLVCRHQAMLKKEYGQIHWISERIKSIKERKSFFRRNCEDKAKAAIFWNKIDPEIQNEYIENAKILVIFKPNEKKIVQKAQGLLWRDFLKPVEEIKIGIDHEDILCLEK